MTTSANPHRAYELARQRYAELGVDTDAALRRLASIPISIHCWQGDDLSGFENTVEEIGGGLAVTGAYPGKARHPDELRGDFEQALSLIPGNHRFSLHAIYAETGGAKVERDELTPEHFSRWIDWAKTHDLGLDFNPTFFAHPKAADGFTLAHPDAAVRRFWTQHGIACRNIGAAMGAALGSPCVTNVWIPDGMKDLPVDRRGPRERLVAALDELFATPLDPAHNLDAVESKLFGIGSESYVVGSHEFYLGYATTHGKLLCLDAGHFHPTEVISDKFSAVMPFVEGLLLHVSRGVRWDSDHIPLLTPDVQELCNEAVIGGELGRYRWALDFFDASINRVAAYVIGARTLRKGLLQALLRPQKLIAQLAGEGGGAQALALQEHLKELPFGAVWDYACLKAGAPVGAGWIGEVERYEREVLADRD
jgi:L-rhamnose isomerase